MKPIVVVVYALLRRFVILASSGILAYILANVMGWAEQSFLADPRTKEFWVLFYFVTEFVQKYIREHRKARNK